MSCWSHTTTTTHLDAATLIRLAQRDNPRVITPLGNDTITKSYDASINVGSLRLALSASISVTASPLSSFRASAGPRRGPASIRNKALWCGFVIGNAGRENHHFGDTGYEAMDFTSAMRAKNTDRSVSPSCRSAPTNHAGSRGDQHMNPEDAVQGIPRLRRRICARSSLRHISTTDR